MKFIAAEASEYPEYQIDHLDLSPKHVKSFDDKLLTVYTGKTRVAKPILWNIVDNWQVIVYVEFENNPVDEKNWNSRDLVQDKR